MGSFELKNRWSVLFLLVCLLMASCTTVPKSETQERGAIPVPPISGPAAPVNDENRIDLFGLQKDLGLSRNSESLGFAERKFNTCDAGFGFSRSNNCQSKYFVVIHFQLLCRDSEGTISRALSSSDMRPISQRAVTWNLKPSIGRLETDGDGYGQIRMIASSSQRQQRLKLTVGNDFLYMRANEITQVVTPAPWCNP